ncbi:hypothetical protein CEE37_09555 [candidate division LCP-89 bacterium B3_LCP]|uniref:Uncharacterized protein n=1 Tax=candidate division LCP-89 bacterium B3_LCP TaxID=2012998 RepID=A0A532UYI5_UNCL8|nr:MAG: hypothetical protein CEE37_09555 [candidate division LCP-89 bacterium B3_LCP]
MKERERLLWSVMIILLLIIAGYVGYNAYRMGRQVREYKEAMKQETLGSEDPQLRQTVEDLETNLRNRLDYSFTIEQDPLDLTQVVQGRRFLANLGFTESLESQNIMRLSCTVIAEEPAAVIKYHGKSRILRVGDVIDGYEIVEIGKGRAKLRGFGETLNLITQKAPETLEREKLLSEGIITIEKPDTTINRGNY